MLPGDRVRVIPTGARATVVRMQGRSVVLEMDEAFAIPGASTRTYYSYPGELEVMPRVGTMGAEVLYAEREGERPESQARLRVGRRGRGVDRSPRACGPLRGGWGERSRRHRGAADSAVIGTVVPQPAISARVFVTATSTPVVKPRSNTSRAIARMGRI